MYDGWIDDDGSSRGTLFCTRTFYTCPKLFLTNVYHPCKSTNDKYDEIIHYFD